MSTSKQEGLFKKVQKSIFDVTDQFIAKVPNYKNTIEYAGESLVLFEIKFDTAVVTKDLSSIETLKL